MVDIDQIRQTQEQRLLPVLKAWDDAKKHLEDAITRAKAREQEFHEVSEDVRRKVSALDLVTSLSKGLGNEVPAAKVLAIETNRPIAVDTDGSRGDTRQNEAVETSTRAFGGLLRKTSRPMFPNMQRSA